MRCLDGNSNTHLIGWCEFDKKKKKKEKKRKEKKRNKTPASSQYVSNIQSIYRASFSRLSDKTLPTFSGVRVDFNSAVV